MRTREDCPCPRSASMFTVRALWRKRPYRERARLLYAKYTMQRTVTQRLSSERSSLAMACMERLFACRPPKQSSAGFEPCNWSSVLLLSAYRPSLNSSAQVEHWGVLSCPLLNVSPQYKRSQVFTGIHAFHQGNSQSPQNLLRCCTLASSPLAIAKRGLSSLCL